MGGKEATRERRRFVAHFGAPLALSASFACAPHEPEPVTLDVVTWWQDPAERHAFGVVTDLHAVRHPNVTIHEDAVPDAKKTRERLTFRLLAGAPPATFQANAGADLLRWTMVDAYGDDGPTTENLLRDVRPLLERTGMLPRIPEVLLQGLRPTGDEGAYAVPINVHRLNVVYYNVDRVRALEERSGRAFLSLDELCAEDGQSALGARLAIGANEADAFPLLLLAFENVLPALYGEQFYMDFWSGRSPATPSGGDWTEAVAAALSCVQRLVRTTAQPNVAALGWADAAATVKNQNGAADFVVMGDWLNGTLRDELEDGSIESAPFPGTERMFVFTSDTFPLPRAAGDLDEAEALLETIASSKAQLEFSKRKGSIPARTDLDVTALGVRASDTKAAFDDPDVAKLPALSGFLPYYYPLDELGVALLAMVEPGAGDAELDAVVRLMETSYPLLSRWQNRLAGGNE